MMELEKTVCYVHPTRETTLRCKKCERYICTSCAQHTPTGYMCRECVRERQKVFDTAVWSDYVIVFFTASILTGIGSAISMMLGLWMVFLAPFAGTFIGNTARRFIKNRRSRALNITLVVSMILGTLPMLLVSGLSVFVSIFMGGSANLQTIYSFLPLVWLIIYLVIVVPSAFYQFSGLVFRN
jgi:hypothetical protein